MAKYPSQYTGQNFDTSVNRALNQFPQQLAQIGSNLDELEQKVALIGDDNVLIGSVVRTDSSGSRKEEKFDIVAGTEYTIINSNNSSSTAYFQFYDANNTTIGSVQGVTSGNSWTGVAPDNAVSLGIISYRAIDVDITTPGKIRLLKEKIDQDLENINSNLDKIEKDSILRSNRVYSEIASGLAAYDGTIADINFKNGASDGKYLKKDTAELKTTASYSVSAPVHLLKGQLLSGHMQGNDVTILAKTDSTGSSYENILNNQTTTYTDFAYTAKEEMYVAVCYRTETSESWLKVSTANCTIEDVFAQVSHNNETIEELNDVVNGHSEIYYTSGGYLRADDIVIQDESAGYSDYIPYQEGNAVLWKFDSQSKNYTLIFYDANKQRLSTGWSAQYSSSVQGRLISAAEIAQYHPNAAYLRASFTLAYQEASVTIGGVEAWVPTVTEGGIIQDIADLDGRVTELENAPAPTQSDTIPEFVLTEGKTTYHRMEEWIGGDSAFILGHITDVHSGGNEKYKHVGYLDKLGVGYGFNLLVNGGDIGLDVSATSEAEDADNLIFETKRQMSSVNKWIFCKGNHERLEPTMKLGNAFNRSFAAVGNGYVFGSEDLSYGYIDDNISKTRTIFINSSDAAVGTHYGMTNAQLQWISTTLANVGNDWKVVVVMHFMPNVIGKWNSDSTGVYEYSFKALRNLLSAFALHTSGSDPSYGLSYDFTSSQASLVCVLTGDSHFNNFVKEDGVNYIVRQGYGGVADTEMPTGATKDSFDYKTQCLFDVLAVKDDGNAKVFRIGAGGSARDLSITY